MKSDAEILACWRKHDAKRIGKRGPEDRNAIDDAAEELGLRYSEVREVVLAHIAMRFAG